MGKGRKEGKMGLKNRDRGVDEEWTLHRFLSRLKDKNDHKFRANLISYYVLACAMWTVVNVALGMMDNLAWTRATFDATNIILLITMGPLYYWLLMYGKRSKAYNGARWMVIGYAWAISIIVFFL